MTAPSGVVVPKGNGWYQSPDRMVVLWLGPDSDWGREVLRLTILQRPGGPVLRIETNLSDDHVSELLDVTDTWEFAVELPAAALPALAFIADYVAGSGQ